MFYSLSWKKKWPTTKVVLATTLFTTLLTLSPAAIQAATPVCLSASSDEDNDGWGWENNASCVVDGNQPTTTNVTAVVYCQYLGSDDNADGWGWENNASCVIGPDSSADTPVTVTNENGKVICQSSAADPDGDGYGWENNTSCVVSGSTAAVQQPTVQQTTTPSCSTASADSDGDGWGWENGASCVIDSTTNAGGGDTSGTDGSDDSGTGTDGSTTTGTDGSGSDSTDGTGSSGTDTTDGTGTDGTDTTGTDSSGTDITGTDQVKAAFLPSDITDLILVTGQSNTLGSNSAVDDTLDAPHPRVFAYTRTGWEVAELYQSWDNGPHPGTGDPTEVSKIHNNFALHFGKRLAELDETTVVGFILVSEPGEGIEHWNPGNAGMIRTQQKTLEAINALPHKSALDGILWHQGETDWIQEGTSDPDVTQPAPTDYYPAKLNELINNFRLENWFDKNTPFICGETIKAEVNVHLNSLNTDSDQYTACVQGAGLTAIKVDGNHFDAPALRTIGKHYAETYETLR